MNKHQQQPQEIVWEAPEFKHYKKTQAWYIGFGIVALGLMVFAIFSKSIITIITFVLLILVSFFFFTQKPKKLTHRITYDGVQVGTQFYPYKNVKFFWIVYEPPYIKTLNFETTASLNKDLVLELEDQDPISVKLMLGSYLPEDLDREESVTDAISRRLKI